MRRASIGDQALPQPPLPTAVPTAPSVEDIRNTIIYTFKGAYVKERFAVVDWDPAFLTM
jgi:hypothetical protein